MRLRLDRIAISNFRGIRKLELRLGGDSIAVVGPNGSGKSSIADAVDFVLTGRINRLTGEGAGQLKLSEHGPHIDADPSEGNVELEFRLEDGAATVSLTRTLAAPGDLVSSESLPDPLREFVGLANDSGGHLLTRKDILEFVRVQPSERARRVAQLLRIEHLDQIRKELAGAAKVAKRQLEDHETRLGALERSVCDCFNPPTASLEEVPNRVNELRRMLGAAPLQDASDPDQWFTGLARAEGPRVAGDSTSLRSLVERLERWVASIGAVVRDVSELLHQARSFREDQVRLASMRADDLLRRGLGLLEEDRCPLCLTEWDQTELREFLETRLQEGAAMSAELESWRARRSGAAVALETGVEMLRSMTVRVDQRDPEIAAPLRRLGDCVLQVVELVPADILDPSAALDQAQEGLQNLREVATALNMGALKELVRQGDVEEGPDVARRILSDARSAYESLTAERSRGGAIKRCAAELAAASRLFLQTRNQVLSETYDAIAGRFSALYRRVHRSDEGSFSAALKPTKAGVDFQVDFYGRGSYPPAALHSEGHQDSMGVLLFLALAEHLSGGSLPLVVLDDVLMSVDKGHRRGMAELLKEEYCDTQFVITTHDEVWWRQLLSLGVARRKTAIKFKAWDIQEGPVIARNAAVMLGEAKQALEEGDVPRAAHALRRAVEVYLPEICHGLGAPVRYRDDGSWQAGDFMNGVQSRYASILKKGKKAAEGWEQDTKPWEERDARRLEVFNAFGTEAWAVNPMVHWNEWADLGVNDFSPVVAAYDGLFSMLTCPNCESCLYVQEEGATETTLRCDCATVNWNLKPKS